MHNRHSAGDVLNTMSAAFLYLTKHLMVLILDWVGLEAKAAFIFLNPRPNGCLNTRAVNKCT